MDNSTAVGAAAGASLGVIILYIALIVFMVVTMWKLFAKAGRPGWACIVPIYNTIVLLEIAGKPIWWILLLFIPVVNIVISVLMYAGLAEKFGRGGGTVVGLIFFPMIFFAILAFGSAEYEGAEVA